jgi:hypothetical protein
MPILPGRDIPTLGTGEETGERYPLQENLGVSISLLPLQADIPILSGRGDESGPDGAVAAVCNDLLAKFQQERQVLRSGPPFQPLALSRLDSLSAPAVPPPSTDEKYLFLQSLLKTYFNSAFERLNSAVNPVSPPASARKRKRNDFPSTS